MARDIAELPTVELHLAATCTCDHCTCEFAVRIDVTYRNALVIPGLVRCPECGQLAVADAEAFLDLFG